MELGGRRTPPPDAPRPLPGRNSPPTHPQRRAAPAAPAPNPARPTWHLRGSPRASGGTSAGSGDTSGDPGTLRAIPAHFVSSRRHFGRSLHNSSGPGGFKGGPGRTSGGPGTLRVVPAALRVVPAALRLVPAALRAAPRTAQRCFPDPQSRDGDALRPVPPHLWVPPAPTLQLLLAAGSPFAFKGSSHLPITPPSHPPGSSSPPPAPLPLTPQRPGDGNGDAAVPRRLPPTEGPAFPFCHTGSAAAPGAVAPKGGGGCLCPPAPPHPAPRMRPGRPTEPLGIAPWSC